MADVFTKEKRSEIMSKIHSPTRLELEPKPAMEATGFEFRPEDVFGKPDYVHRGAKIAVFIDGCFWHGCPIHYREPKTNKRFWRKKIERNKKRDKEVNEGLRMRGWLVVRHWEHEIR